MRAKKIIVANWKLNPETPREALRLFSSVSRVARGLRRSEAVICPPAHFLGLFHERLSGGLFLGGQDVFAKNQGAFTGAGVSARSLYYLGGRYAIVGHSERRALGDGDETVAQKAKAAASAGLKVVLCVGEAIRDETGRYFQFLRQQLLGSLIRLPRRFFAERLIVAYEPIWAVGAPAQSADTPADFLRQQLFIKKVISDLAGKETAMRLPVIYGGSVDQKNAAGFLDEGQANGLLVGRASLRPDYFTAILKAADALA